jgi:O-antigen ligase
MTVALVAAVAIAVLGFKSGGYFPAMWSWVTFALSWTLIVTLALRPPRSWSRRELALVAALVTLAAWTLLSAVWSVDPSQSVREAERTLLYAVVVTTLFAVAQLRPVGELAAAVLTAVTVVSVYALGHYLFAAHPRPEGFEGFLLFRPVGYANAVGILAALALLLGLGFAIHASHRGARALAAAALVPLASTLVLTQSRASWLAAGIGLLCALALEHERALALTRALTPAPPVALAVWLSHRAGLESGSPLFRSGAAERLGLELIALTAVTGAVGALVRVGASRAAALACAGAAVAVVAVALAAGHVPAGGSDDARSEYWRMAWHEWEDQRVLGSGAGTFAVYWSRTGTAGGAQDAHNLYLETLAELGPVGLALLLVALVLPLTAAVAARRAPHVPALMGAYVAYLVHVAFDWDWEMPVVTVAALSCGAALVLAARGAASELGNRGRIAALSGSAVLLVVAVAELVGNGAVSG